MECREEALTEKGLKFQCFPFLCMCTELPRLLWSLEIQCASLGGGLILDSSLLGSKTLLTS